MKTTDQRAAEIRTAAAARAIRETEAELLRLKSLSEDDLLREIEEALAKGLPQ